MLVAIAQKTVAGLVGFSVRRAAFVLAAYASLFVAAILAAANYLEINTDPRGMLNPELPFQKRTIALEDAFPHLPKSIVVVLESEVPDAADAIAASLVESLGGQAGIASVFSESASPFFRTHAPLYIDAKSLEESLNLLDSAAVLLAALREDPSAKTLFGNLAIFNRLGATEAETAELLDGMYANIAAVIEAKAAGEPAALSWQNLMAGSKEPVLTTRLVQVMPKLDYTKLQPAETALSSINAAIAALPTTVGSTTAALVTERVTGEPALMFEELNAVADGILLSLGASMIAVIVLLILCFGSIWRTIVTLLSTAVALGLALGFASIALGPLNLVSIAFVVPLMGLGLDFAIHVITRARELETKGIARNDAFTEAGRGIALALALSALTTAAAFLSFSGTDFVGMGQVGILGAVGVLIAFALSLTLVPALATVVPPKAPAINRSSDAPATSASASATRGRGLRNAATGALVILAFASIAAAPELRFDTDPTNLRDPQSPSMVALAGLMSNPDTAPYRISLIGTEDEVRAFADQADRAREADHVITLDRLVPDDQETKLRIFDEFHPYIMERISGPSRLPAATGDAIDKLVEELGERPTGAGSDKLRAVLATHDSALRSPEVDEALTLYLPQLIELISAQANIGPVDTEDLPLEVRRQFVSPSGLYRAEVSPAHDLRVPENRTNFVDEMIAINGKVSGAPLEITRAGEVVSSAIVQATSIAALVVSVMCLIFLRSFRETLAVLVPLLIAGLLVMGSMVLIDLPFNYANVIVLPLIIGLGVDSSIHLALRKREIESGSVYATSTPRAVLFSGLTTAVAFVSLALSSHRGTASIGELLGLSIAIVLLTTLVVTPTLLELLKPQRPSGTRTNI